MSWINWVLFLLVIQVVHGLGTWKMYVAAGRKAWEAFVPFYNAIVLTKIINRPWYYALLLFLPVVNLIMLIVFWVETNSVMRSKSPYHPVVPQTVGILLEIK